MNTLVEMKSSGHPSSPPQPKRSAKRARSVPARPSTGDDAGGDGRLGQFESEAARVLGALSIALRKLFESLTTPIERARHVETALGVDYTLAWRTYRLATAKDPIALGAEVPRPGPMQRFLEAAERRRVSPIHIKCVGDAYKDFEALVLQHAGHAANSGRGGGKRVGGRSVFDSLIGNVNGVAAPKLELVHRRATYKGNSYIWGVQMETCLRCVIWHTGKDPGTHDDVLIGGYRQVHALRRDIPLRLKRRSGVNISPAIVSQDPYVVAEQIRVLEQYCTHPLPELTTTIDPYGFLETTLKFEGIGRGAAVDHYVSELNRNVNGGIPQPTHSMTMMVTFPAEKLLAVMLVPRGWADPASVRVSTHGNPSMLEGLPARIPEFRLPVNETAEYLGTSLTPLDTPDVPRLPEIIQGTLDDAGWTGTEFDIFRCRIRYPIMQTCVRLQVDTTKL